MLIGSVLQSHDGSGEGERIKVVRHGAGVSWRGELDQEFVRVVEALGGCYSAWLSRSLMRLLLLSVTRLQ